RARAPGREAPRARDDVPRHAHPNHLDPAGAAMTRAWLVLAIAACGHKDAPAPSQSPPPPTAGHKGAVSTRTFHSDALGVDKDYVVYLPFGYDANKDARYPVLYYLHGLTGDEHSWVKGGHIDDAADAMSLPAIIVMPDGDDGFYADSSRAID